jgi:hypothetical protein
MLSAIRDSPSEASVVSPPVTPDNKKEPGSLTPRLFVYVRQQRLLHVLADEGEHMREGVADLGQVRRMAGLAVAVEVVQLDVAAGLA